MKTIFAILLMCFAGFSVAQDEEATVNYGATTGSGIDMEQASEDMSTIGTSLDDGELTGTEGLEGLQGPEGDQGSDAMGDDGDAGPEGPQP